MAATSPPGVGLLKGLGVTLKHMLKPAVTQQYPHVKPDLAPRTRGVIALMDENCTVCMLCSRECPDWCIYIDSHKETVPPAKEGGRARTRNVLDRFAIDFALCMYCGICVEVCPFDALFWSPEFEYSEYDMGKLLHEKEKLREWMDTVPPPPALDDGAEAPAEVAEAIAKKERELEEAAAKAAEAERAEQQAAEAKDAPSGAGKAAEPEIEVKAGEIDQETFDQLIAEGKSERMARAKAKAAYVKKEKARLKAEAEAKQAAAPAAPEPEVKAGEIDQETYDALIAEGKSERMARAKAKAAYVKKEKARLRAEAEAAGGAEEAGGAGAAGTGDAGAEASPTDDAAPTAPRKGDIHVEGAGEIDQETYDALIAEGKSERIARSKAKAAWVRKKKQEQIDGGSGDDGGEA
jgi:NADH-quinone oxidoreductase subunit I